MKFNILVTSIFIFLLGGFVACSLQNKKSEKSQVSADLLEEVDNRSLVTTGEVPTWLSGTLVRNGPINVTVNGESNVHWFDGLAMLHAFSFQDGKINYSNKFLRSEAYHTVFEKGSAKYDGFGSDPCRSLFKQFFTFFFSSSDIAIHNANVNVAKVANAYVALTEIPLPVKFDPQTLETLGVLDYQDQLPKDKCFESAHPHHDVRQKEVLNYLIKYGQTSYYTLFSLREGSAERKIIAEVPVEEPAYMHTFALTENYVIFTEFPLVVKPLHLIATGKPFIKNFYWHPERGTRFIVIDRKNGSVVGKYFTKPFFAFHHANAFEKDGMIHMDIAAYKDASIITGNNFYMKTDKMSHKNYPSQLERFSLSLTTGEITSQPLLTKSIEFPRINETLDGLPHRYVYVVGFSSSDSDEEDYLNSRTLYKVNTDTKDFLTWSEQGCSPGEPVFVAATNAKDEDEGVVLALILDQVHKDSFLLILDGKSFKELGRARAPHLIPVGLHGQYFQSVQ